MAFYGFLIIVSIIAAVFILNNVSYMAGANGSMLHQLHRYRNIVMLEAFQNIVLNTTGSAALSNNSSVIVKAEAEADGFVITGYGRASVVSSVDGPYVYWTH